MDSVKTNCYRYEETKRDVTKWTPIVRANREAPTLVFTAPRNDVPRTTTTAALTSKFQPSSGGMEAEVAAMLTAAGISSDKGVEDAEEALALQVSPGRSPSNPIYPSLFSWPVNAVLPCQDAILLSRYKAVAQPW